MLNTDEWMLETGFGLGGIFTKVLGGNPANFELFSDEYWMHQALSYAMNGIGIANPNPEVGCVIVEDGKIVSFGITEKVGGRHAERVAIESAQQQGRIGLSRASLYVTLEPCSHTGRQPPCVESIIKSGIKRCVVGCMDPNPLVLGYGIKRLKENGIEVVHSRISSACQAWHYRYLASQKNKGNGPLFFGKWAQTIDGMLADEENCSQWITGGIARRYTHWLRQKYDAIMVGAKTVLCDEPRLTVRDCQPIVRQPIKIICDPRGKLLDALPNKQKSLKSTIFDGDQVVYVLSENDKSRFELSWVKEVSAVPIFVANESKDFWHGISQALQSPEIELVFGRKLESVFIEGGANVLSAFLERDLLEACHVFMTPGFLGGERNKIFSSDQCNSKKKLEQLQRFHLIASHALGNDFVVEFGKMAMQRW